MGLSSTQIELMNDLYKKYGLRADDIFHHKHYTIITRPGIEKIQAIANITVNFEEVYFSDESAVVKATATKPNYEGEVSTYGSANTKTISSGYFAELAEKRALSRVVLKLENLYQMYVFGEDEAEDFQQKNVVNSPRAQIK
jgi:hypothetical protein